MRKDKALIGQSEALAREKRGHYRSRIALTRGELLLNNPERAEMYLDACPDQRQWEWHHLKNRLHAERRTLTATLPNHASLTHLLTFSRDGKRLFASCSRVAITVWDVSTGKEAVGVKRPGIPFSGMFALGRDGQLLMETLSRPQRILTMWEPTSARKVFTLPLRIGLSSADFSPDGRFVALGGRDGMVKLLDAKTGQEVRGLGQLGGPARTLAFSPDGKRLAAGVNRGVALKVWDVGTGQEALAVEAPSSGRLVWSPDGRFLATNSGKAVNLWDSHTGKMVASLETRFGVADLMTFSPDGERLAVGERLGVGGNGLIRIWDVGKRRELFAIPLLGYLQSLTYSPDGKFLAAGVGNEVKLFDARTGPGVLVIRRDNGWALSVSFSPDSRQLAATYGDGTVRFYETATGREVQALVHSLTQAARAAAFSPDGSRFASAGSDGVIQVWDRATSRPVCKCVGHRGGINRVAFSPDGERLASASEDKTVKLWAVATGRELRTLTGHAPGVDCLAFSPDGQRLASGASLSRGRDGKTHPSEVKVWDLAMGKEILGWQIPSSIYSPGPDRMERPDHHPGRWERGRGDLLGCEHRGRSVALWRRAEV